MPIGIVIDVCSLLAGGILGALFGKRITEPAKEAMNNIFGFCAMAIGVRLIVRMDNLSAVILAAVLGTVVGEGLRLEKRVDSGVKALSKRLLPSLEGDEKYFNLFCAVAVIFCCSGTGWYGALNEGFSGDSSILVTKAILDFFTAMIFSAALGRLVCCLALPQLLIYAALFAVSRLVVPYITDSMVADFSAVGGIVELATGMRIAGVKRDTAVVNIIPAMIIVFPISALWSLLF